MIDPVQLTRRFVDTPSITGEEAAFGTLLCETLGELGLSPQTQVVDGNRVNVHTLTRETTVVFCTHMDTVGPYITSSEDSEFVRGRGSCDAKGILAAMVAALSELHVSGEDRVGLLAVVGEETDSLGARVASDLAGTSKYVVVGEPTEGLMATGHKGALSATLRASGRAAHSGYPEWGRSAIHDLLAALDLIRVESWGTDAVLGDATVNVGTISGGVAVNMIAPEAEARIMIRLVGPGAEARERLANLLAACPNVEAVDVSASNPVSCHTLEGFSTAPVSFGSDLPWLKAFGEPLLFGPGSIRQAHTPDEYIAKKDLIGAVHSYQSIATLLLE